MSHPINQCLHGDCRDVMRKLIEHGVKVQCIVTSPPYWGLRDYGVSGQLGDGRHAGAKCGQGVWERGGAEGDGGDLGA